MKVSQINLHHSKAASAALVLRLATGTEDLICIQEPWLYKDWVRGLNKDGYSILYAAGPGKTRACIMVKSNLKAFILSDFSDKDTCTIALENKRRVVWFMSCYMAHDHGDDPPNSMTRKAMSNANRKNIPLVICADANAHHTIWGSSDINQRGESLLNFIVDNKLTIVNRGNEPTFIVTNRREVLDVTLISDKFSYLISDWSVSKDCSFSDHLYIDFNFSIEVDKVEHYLNRRKTNWSTHSKVLSDMLPSCPTSIDDKSSLDSAVVSLTKALADATEKSCMKTIRKGKAKPAWWNAEIAEKRKECRKLFNEAKVYGNWSTYKSSCNKFKNLVRKAKRQSWRKYCSGIENSSETSRLRKILSLNPTIPSYIQKTDGSWTTSSKDTLEVLMDTHFPGCKELDTLPMENLNTDVQDISGIPITQDRIRWAVKSFSPFKSPGPDGIIPADLQNNIDLLLPWLMKIFKACLQLSHVPSIWTTYKIVFIPKGGKTSHTKAKDFRPISLSSFLLKTLERIIDTFIRSSLNAEDLSNTQHAYMKGKSTETALHTLVGHIERSLHYKEYTLVAFLDIEGAFNNVKPESVLDAMRQLRIDAAVTSFVEKLLNFRRIESNLGVSNIQKIATRGTPQGGVLSPLLWNININTLLKAMEMTCCKTVAYADDVAVVATGKDLNILSEILESALNLLAKWCQGCGLGVNPTKTELVLFTRRYRIPKFNTPRINGVSLSLSNEAKYLGLILDSKLNWNLNTNNRTTKAVNALYCCKKAIGLNWGLNPRNAYWLCNCVIRPILFYGATVWWPALEKSYQQAKFERIMRMMSIMTTGALRTTPSKALFTILNWLPPDIAAKKIAAQTALRLCATRAWKYQGYGHANILGNIYREYKVDYSIPTPFFDSGFMVHIPDGSYYDNGLHTSKTELVLFTRRYRIPKFNTPRINGVSLSLSNEAKYLGLILDSKLNWNLNTNNRTTKAVNALYCCKKAIGLNWGLNPRNAYWLCNCVIRPILFYGATVWWPALEKSYQQAKFERIMRMMSIMTTGALRTTPSKALFTILNWLPPDIAAKKIAAQTALRLCATRAWKYQGYGHANILGNIYREYKVDYSIPTPLFDSGFMVHIPEGSYYDNGLHTSEEEIQIFTDGSKSKDRVGIGIFSEQLDLKLSHTLPNYCSVIQAEIMAIKTAVQWIQYMDISNKDIRIFTDSKAALSSLSGVYTTSKIVRECRMSLEEIASHSNVTLTWVPGHRDIYGNCVADSLARAGAGQNHHGHICDIGAPLSVCKQLISREFHLKGMERWTTESTCVETRKIWPLMEERRTAQLLNLSRSHLRNLIGVITGHWPFGIHAKRLGIHHYDYCRSCKDEEEEETTEHLLCHCPIFEYQRHQLFGLQRITDKSCLSRVDPSRLNSFIVTTRWFAGPNGQEV